jgi:glycosyltransferase involved in cell wall biosynthesis
MDRVEPKARPIDSKSHRVGTGSSILLASNYSNHTGYAWRNIYRLFEAICGHLQEQDIRVVVSFDPLEPPVDPPGVSCFSDIIEMSVAPSGLRGLADTLFKLRSQRVVFLYLTDQAPVSWRYPLYRAAGVRRIIVHSRVSVPDPRPAPPERGLKGLIKHVLSRIPPLRADAVYAVSDFVRNRLILKARFPPERVHRVLNGIDLREFEFAPRPSDPPRVRIAATGRASRHKGIHVLIEAAHLLRSRLAGDDFVVEYAGDGPELEFFRQTARRLGLDHQVRFLGETDGSAALLERSDIVVVPSVWGDACPSAVAEGLASGRALVATEVGGVPEQIGGRDNAILVPPGDAEALAEAIHQLIRDPELRAGVGQRGRRRAEEALSLERYHDEVFRRLRTDLARARRSP